MCPKDTDRPENELGRNFKGKIRLFWTKFSYCIFVQRSSTGLYGVPMAIILQPISIRKCNINTLTYHFPATQGRSVKGLFYLEFRSILFFLNTRNMVFYYQQSPIFVNLVFILVITQPTINRNMRGVQIKDRQKVKTIEIISACTTPETLVPGMYHFRFSMMLQDSAIRDYQDL